jgi:hypothetical protein
VKLRKPKIASGNCYNQLRDIFVSQPYTVPGENVPFTTQDRLLRGSRNSIGAIVTVPPADVFISTGVGTDYLNSLTPAQFTGVDKRMLDITIPDSYSGILRIHIRASFSTALSVANNKLVAVSLAPSTILRFKDIPITPEAPKWTHINSNAELYDNPTGFPTSVFIAELELHVRVLPPVNGTKNILQIGWLAGFTMTGSVSTTMIDISQYNSFHNVRDDGSNDRLELVAPSGVLTSWAGV